MSKGSPAKKTGKRLFKAIRFLGILLFVFILFRVDLRAVGSALITTDLSLLLIGVLFQLIVLFSKGIRWHLMNDGRKPGKFWLISLGRFYESYAIGVVTPGRMGDLLKAGHENGKNNMLAAGLRVLAERGIDIGVFVALAGLSVFSGYYIEMRPAFGFFIIGAGAVIVLASYLVMASKHFTKLANKLFLRFHDRWKDFTIEGRRYPFYTLLWIVLMSFISNLSYFASCYSLGMAAGIDAGFIWISGAVAVSGLLNMLPVTIMGLGTRELIFLYVFQSFEPDMVLAFSFLVVLIAQIGGGLFSLIAGQYLLIKSRKHSYD